SVHIGVKEHADASGLAARHRNLLGAQQRDVDQAGLAGSYGGKLRRQIGRRGKDRADDVVGLQAVCGQDGLCQFFRRGDDQRPLIGFDGDRAADRSKLLQSSHPAPWSFSPAAGTARCPTLIATSSRWRSPMPAYIATATWPPPRATPTFPPMLRPKALGKSCWIASCAAPATAPSSAWVPVMTPSLFAETTARSMMRRTVEVNSPP